MDIDHKSPLDYSQCCTSTSPEVSNNDASDLLPDSDCLGSLMHSEDTIEKALITASTYRRHDLMNLCAAGLFLCKLEHDHLWFAYDRQKKFKALPPESRTLDSFLDENHTKTFLKDALENLIRTETCSLSIPFKCIYDPSWSYEIARQCVEGPKKMSGADLMHALKTRRFASVNPSAR